MKTSDIEYILKQGENSAVEFKIQDINPVGLAKEIIAFSNTNGGVIFIGVEDNATISGIETDKNWEEWVMNISRRNIVPPVNPEFEYVTIENKTIAVINIPKGNNKPYQTQEGKYYIRVGSTNRIASIAELMRLFQESGAFHFDLRPVQRTSKKTLNLDIVYNFFTHYEINFEEETTNKQERLLVNSDILADSGEMTVAGLLMFGINPARYLPQSGIIFVHYNGTDVTGEVIDSKHIDGNMNYVISTTFAVIKHNILTPSTIVGVKRVDTNPTYADKVFRELITNCCAHRNYAISGSKIRILMFSDRIEFISPGKLPNTVTVEKLRAGVSFRRNQLLTKFMVAFRLMDTFGRGLPNVIAEVQRRNKTIVFEETGEEFKVTLEL